MQAVGGKERAATDGETDPLKAQIHDKVREAAQAWEAAEGAAECKSQATELRITLDDVRLWSEIGERCKRVEFYFKELTREQEAIDKLVAGTPLRYSYRAVSDVLADNFSQTSGEQQDEQPPQDHSQKRSADGAHD